VGFNPLVSLAGLPAGRYELGLVRWEDLDMLGVKTGKTITVGPAGQISVE
jgi:hypothetical protein